jgi:hypothetical protein
MSPAQVLAQQQARKRSQGLGGKVLGGLKGLWGVAASPFATVLDVVPGYEPEQVGSFNIFQQGGKSLEHVGGDAYQLGRSVLTGKDTLSESPSARAYQAAGEGITGAFAAAMPYVDVATAVYPFAKAATPAGALAIERAAGEAVASRNLAEGIANATPSAARPRGMSADLAVQIAGQDLRTINQEKFLNTPSVTRMADEGTLPTWMTEGSQTTPPQLLRSGNRSFIDEIVRPTEFDSEAGLNIQQRHLYSKGTSGQQQFGITYDLIWSEDNPYAIDITQTFGEGKDSIKDAIKSLATKHNLPIVGPFTTDPDYYRAFLELRQENPSIHLIDKEGAFKWVKIDGERFKQLATPKSVTEIQSRITFPERIS